MKNNSNYSFIIQNNDGIILKLYVLPKSSRNLIVGIHNDELKIKISAPPVDGAANKMCIKFLSKLLNIPKSNLKILAGKSSKHKQILITCNYEIEKIISIIKN